MAFILTALLTSIIQLLVLVPVVLLAWWSTRNKRTDEGLRFLAIAATVFIATAILLRAPRFGFFADLQFNWQNKLLAFVAALLFIWLWRGISWREVGLRAPVRGSLRPTLIALAVLMPLAFLGSIGLGAPTTEELLFQLTVPGLHEELVYRGILLVLIDRAFATRWTLWGAQVGWGLVVTTLLFGLIHGLQFDGGLVFIPPSIIATGIVGFVLCWVRYRSGSIWPCVLLHNAFNTFLISVPWLL